jgi:TetR/AcrR family transcriptional regulator
MERNSEESKKRILNAAARVFAEKGFNGARMDEIARKAKVNKALIYYYFKSKKRVLSELFKKFFRESTGLLLNFVERGGFSENAEENKKLFEKEYSGYLETNEDLIKIIVMESIKSDIDEVPIFNLVDISNNEQDDRVNSIELNIDDDEQKLMYIAEFFTGIMPFISYIVFKNKWCKHFNMKEEELKNYFDRAMEETHEQYHKKRGKKF